MYISDVPTGEWPTGVDQPQQTHVRHRQKAIEHVKPVSASSDNSAKEEENPEPRLMRQATGKHPTSKGPS